MSFLDACDGHFGLWEGGKLAQAPDQAACGAFGWLMLDGNGLEARGICGLVVVIVGGWTGGAYRSGVWT